MRSFLTLHPQCYGHPLGLTFNSLLSLNIHDFMGEVQ